jgi:hypothetical protein
VEAAARRAFAPPEVDGVLALLAAYGVERYETSPEVIRLALLRIVNGDRAALQQWVAWAKSDWRDVLLAVHQTYGTSWEAPFLEGLR